MSGRCDVCNQGRGRRRWLELVGRDWSTKVLACWACYDRDMDQLVDELMFTRAKARGREITIHATR